MAARLGLAAPNFPLKTLHAVGDPLQDSKKQKSTRILRESITMFLHIEYSNSTPTTSEKLGTNSSGPLFYTFQIAKAFIPKFATVMCMSAERCCFHAKYNCQTGKRDLPIVGTMFSSVILAAHRLLEPRNATHAICSATTAEEKQKEYIVLVGRILEDS